MTGTRPGERNPQLVSVGIVVTVVGGIALAVGLVASLPSGVAVAGVVCFVAGIVVVGVGGGLRTAWEVFKALLP